MVSKHGVVSDEHTNKKTMLDMRQLVAMCFEMVDKKLSLLANIKVSQLNHALIMDACRS